MKKQRKSTQRKLTEMFANPGDSNNNRHATAIKAREPPVPFDVFKMYIKDFSSVVSKYKDNVASTSRDNGELRFYRDFYSNPEIQKLHPVTLLPCPLFLKNKILRTPGELTDKPNQQDENEVSNSLKERKQHRHKSEKRRQYPVDYETFKKYLNHEKLMKSVLWVYSNANVKEWRRLYRDKDYYEKILRTYYRSFYKSPEHRNAYAYEFKDPSPEMIEKLLSWPTGSVEDHNKRSENIIKDTNQEEVHDQPETISEERKECEKKPMPVQKESEVKSSLVGSYENTEKVIESAQDNRNEEGFSKANQNFKLSLSSNYDAFMDQAETINERLSFPIAAKKLESFVENLDEILEEIVRESPFLSTGKETRLKIAFHEFYRIFYLFPEFRNFYKCRYKKCPLRVREKFLQTPTNTDYSMILFPVAINTFKEHLNYEKILDKLITTLLGGGVEAKSDEKLCKRLFEAYYFSYYLSPHIIRGLFGNNFVEANENINCDLLNLPVLKPNNDLATTSLGLTTLEKTDIVVEEAPTIQNYNKSDCMEFPVPIEIFKKFVNYKEVMSSMLRNLSKNNKKKYDELRCDKNYCRKVFSKLYHKFYVDKSFRRKLHVTFDNAPPEVLEKLLSFAVIKKKPAAIEAAVPILEDAEQPTDLNLCEVETLQDSKDNMVNYFPSNLYDYIRRMTSYPIVNENIRKRLLEEYSTLIQIEKPVEESSNDDTTGEINAQNEPQIQIIANELLPIRYIEPSRPVFETEEVVEKTPTQSPQLPAENPSISSKSPQPLTQSPKLPAEHPSITTKGPQPLTQSPQLTDETPQIPTEKPQPSAQSPQTPTVIAAPQTQCYAWHLPENVPRIATQEGLSANSPIQPLKTKNKIKKSDSFYDQECTQSPAQPTQLSTSFLPEHSSLVRRVMLENEPEIAMNKITECTQETISPLLPVFESSIGHQPSTQAPLYYAEHNYCFPEAIASNVCTQNFVNVDNVSFTQTQSNTQANLNDPLQDFNSSRVMVSLPWTTQHSPTGIPIKQEEIHFLNNLCFTLESGLTEGYLCDTLSENVIVIDDSENQSDEGLQILCMNSESSQPPVSFSTLQRDLSLLSSQSEGSALTEGQVFSLRTPPMDEIRTFIESDEIKCTEGKSVPFVAIEIDDSTDSVDDLNEQIVRDANTISLLRQVYATGSTPDDDKLVCATPTAATPIEATEQSSTTATVATSDKTIAARNTAKARQTQVEHVAKRPRLQTDQVPQLKHAFRPLPKKCLQKKACLNTNPQQTANVRQEVANEGDQNQIEPEAVIATSSGPTASQALACDNTFFDSTLLHKIVDQPATATTPPPPISLLVESTNVTIRKVNSNEDNQKIVAAPQPNAYQYFLTRSLVEFNYFNAVTDKHIAQHKLLTHGIGQPYQQAVIKNGTKCSVYGALLPALFSSFSEKTLNDLQLVLADLGEFHYNRFKKEPVGSEDLRVRVLHTLIHSMPIFSTYRLDYEENTFESALCKPVTNLRKMSSSFKFETQDSLKNALKPRILEQMAEIKKRLKR